jgi:hypothetical protein
MRMLREPPVLDKVGVGKTTFHERYIKTGRARWIYSGRIKRMPEHEVDRLIQEDIAAADQQPIPPSPNPKAGQGVERRRREAV